MGTTDFNKYVVSWTIYGTPGGMATKDYIQAVDLFRKMVAQPGVTIILLKDISKAVPELMKFETMHAATPTGPETGHNCLQNMGPNSKCQVCGK